MEIYELTQRGQALAHNIYAPANPSWRVIQFLNQRGQATKEAIMNYVPAATGHTLYKLRRKEVIRLVGQTVEV